MPATISEANPLEKCRPPSFPLQEAASLISGVWWDIPHHVRALSTALEPAVNRSREAHGQAPALGPRHPQSVPVSFPLPPGALWFFTFVSKRGKLWLALASILY